MKASKFFLCLGFGAGLALADCADSDLSPTTSETSTTTTDTAGAAVGSGAGYNNQPGGLNNGWGPDSGGLPPETPVGPYGGH